MVVITNAIPTAGFQPSTTPPDESQAGLLATDVPDNGNLPPPGRGPRGVNAGGGLKTIIIGGAIATGIGVGLGVGLGPGGPRGCRVSTNANCP